MYIVFCKCIGNMGFCVFGALFLSVIGDIEPVFEYLDASKRERCIFSTNYGALACCKRFRMVYFVL